MQMGESDACVQEFYPNGGLMDRESYLLSNVTGVNILSSWRQ